MKLDERREHVRGRVLLTKWKILFLITLERRLFINVFDVLDIGPGIKLENDMWGLKEER
jgi:hypothetical protein